MNDKQRCEIIDRLFNEAIEGEKTYAAYFARFMRSLSTYADGLTDYNERALFLRVAGAEIGFSPADFWDVVEAAQGREVSSQLAAVSR